MRYKYREELPGKRFLCVNSCTKTQLPKISNWKWRVGIIRASSHRDPTHPELSVLLEYDDEDWKARRWVHVYDSTFLLFLVEYTLVWAPSSSAGIRGLLLPALTFLALVDKANLARHHLKPVEFVRGRELGFVNIAHLQGNDLNDSERGQEFSEVQQWSSFQESQMTLINSPSQVIGNRVQVYRTAGTVQWYTAFISSCCQENTELRVTDDTVLEDHLVNPCLVQMMLIESRGRNWQDNLRNRNIEKQEEVKATEHKKLVRNNKFRKECSNAVSVDGQNFCRKRPVDINNTQKQLNIEPVQVECQLSKRNALILSSDTEGQTGELKKESVKHTNNVGDNTNQTNTAEGLNSTYSPNRNNLHISLSDQPNNRKCFKEERDEYFIVREKEALKEAKQPDFLNSSIKAETQSPNSAFSDFETVKLVDEKFIHQTVIETYESILNKITECELPFRGKTTQQDLFIKGELNKGDCKRTEIVTQSLPEPSVNNCINSTTNYKHSETQKELNRICKKFSPNSTQSDVTNLHTLNKQNSHGKNLSLEVNEKELKFSDSLITRSTSLTSIGKKISLPKIKNVDYLDIAYPIYSETINLKKCSNYISDFTIKKESTEIREDKKISSLYENVDVDTKISDFQAAVNSPKVPISNKSSSLINESSCISTKFSSFFNEYELSGSTNVNKKLKNGCVIKNIKRELKIDTLADLASKAKKIVTSEKGNEENLSSDHPSVSTEGSKNVITRCSVIQSVSDCIAKLKETCATELDIKVKRECSENTDHCEQFVATSDGTKRKQGDAIAKTEIALSTTTNLTPMHPSRLGPNNRATSGMYSGITQEVQNHRSGLPPTHVPPFGISSTQLFRPHIPSTSGNRQISPLDQRVLHSQPYRNFIPRHGVVLPHFGVEAMWHQKYPHMGAPPSNHWGNAQYHEDLRRKKERMTVRDLEKRSRFDRVKHDEKEFYEKIQKSSHHTGKKEGASAKFEKAVVEKSPENSTKSYVKENSNQKPLPSPSNQSKLVADNKKKDLNIVCTTTSSSSHGGEPKSLVNKLRSIPEKNKNSGCTLNSTDQKNEQVQSTPCSVSGTESLDTKHSRSKAESSKINTCESSNSGSIIESTVSTTASCSQSAQETKFSLYGYQPFLHTYITAAELKANDITKTLTVNQFSAPGSPQLKEKGRNGQMLSSHSQVNSPASEPPPLSPKIPICDNEASLLSFNEVRTSKSCNLAPSPVAASQSYNQSTSIKHSASDSQDKNNIPEEKSCQSDNPLACLSNIVSTTSNSITETILTHSVVESDFGTHPSVSLECKVSPTQKDSYSTKQSTSRNSPCQTNASQFLEHNKAVGSPLGTSHFQRTCTPPVLEAHGGCLNFSHRSPSPAHISTASLGQISSNLSSGCQSPAHQSSHRYSPVVSLFKCDSSILDQTQPLNLQTISNTAGKHKNTDDILVNSKRQRSLDSSLQPPCLQPEMKESTTIGKMANASPANSDSSKMITTTLSPVYSSSTSRFPLTLPLKVMTTVTPDVSDPNSPNQISKSEKNYGELPSLQEQADIQTPLSATNCNISGFLDSFRSFVSSAQSHPVTPQKKSHHRKRIKSSSPPPDDLSQSSSASLSNNGTPQHKGTASSVLSGSSGPHDSSDEARATPSPAPSTGTVFSGSSASSGTGHTKLKKTWLQRHSETEDIKQHKSKAQLEQSSEIDLHYKIDQERHFKHRRAKAICTDKLVSKSHKKNDNKEENFQDSDSSSSASESIRVKRKKQMRRKNCVAAKESSANSCRHFGANSETQSDYTEESSFSSKKDEDKRYLCDRVSRRGGKAKKRGRPAFTHKKKIGKKPAINFQKRTRKPFLQHCPCFEIAPKLAKCRECRIAAYNRNKKIQNSYCRFLAYRKLYYTKNGSVLNAGFSEPSDAKDDDLKLWLPSQDNPPDDLNVETSKALLGHVGDQFCDLIEQEKEALSLHFGKDTNITWKRIVQGVREMCDVCDTTLFNLHWVCHKCGFAVCIDCYKGRKQGIVREDEDSLPKDRDEYQWLLCSGRQPHEQEKLIMTQIVAGSALWDMGKTLHKVREIWKIPSYCKCIPREEDESGSKYFSNGICKQLMSAVTKCFSTDKAVHMNSYSGSIHCTQRAPKRTTNGVSGFLRNNADLKEFNSEIGDSALRWLADVALKTSGTLENENSLESDTKSQKNFTNCYDSCDDNSALRELLIQKPDKERNGGYPAPRKSLCSTLDDVIACVIEQNVGKGKSEEEAKLIHFSRRYPQPRSGHDPLPIRICTLTESTIMYPDVPHSWLCNGRLLLLHEPHNDKNLKLFQEQWKRGQPILVAKVSERLNMSLWHPDGFCRDFGEIRNDLVNCKTGSILPNLPMRKFWEGFENFSKRMKDEYGEYMLLKLKDWPPGEDFSEMLPLRFQDLMNGLPLPQYTHRDGILNLAGRLPSCFVRPDLGPKMYNAYGSALYPTKGTTNLHLDISDAVNVMVYVGIPYDGKDEDHIQEALKAIDEGGCDSLMRRRVRERGVRPGALWHIYNARDADKIRDLLNKVAIERGEKLEAHHDPIHDQSWYLDEELRERLYQEYGVEGYAIAQCLGDAVFIPAGAPHQVRNLHSCVKVAEDFVSPENIAHCFQLTQEFRNLSDTHTNHEDKLQIKNIIYHVVRDALAHLLAANHETGV